MRARPNRDPPILRTRVPLAAADPTPGPVFHFWAFIRATSSAPYKRTLFSPNHGTARRDAYMHMLQSGSSKYPVDLLKGAGVDMTTSAPFQSAIHEMNSVMDQMEKLLRSR